MKRVLIIIVLMILMSCGSKKSVSETTDKKIMDVKRDSSRTVERVVDSIYSPSSSMTESQISYDDRGMIKPVVLKHSNDLGTVKLYIDSLGNIKLENVSKGFKTRNRDVLDTNHNEVFIKESEYVDKKTSKRVTRYPIYFYIGILLLIIYIIYRFRKYLRIY